jgi:DNA-directed RNA polymerase specialized sigma24 family protein
MRADEISPGTFKRYEALVRSLAPSLLDESQAAPQQTGTRPAPNCSEEDLPASSYLELSHAIVSAVLGLEDQSRRCLVAMHYEGLNPSQVAQREDCSVDDVLARLGEAIGSVRRTLDSAQGGDWRSTLRALRRARR